MKTFFLILFISNSSLSQETINQLHSWDSWFEVFIGMEKEESLGKNFTHKYKVGVSEFYYDIKKTQLMSRVENTKKNTYYIDFYDKNKTQICFNGNGKIYVIENGSKDFPHRDSLVYQITNKAKTGKFQRFRRYLNGRYFLIEDGYLINNVKQGQWIYNDTISGFKENANYKNGRLFGYFYRFKKSSNINEEGEYKDGEKIGKWTIKDTNSTYVKTEFKNNNYLGLYTAYWKNDSIKEKGEYKQIKGEKEILFTDIETGKTTKEIQSVNNLPVKNGIWTYYDIKGELIKTEMYKNGKLQ